MTSDPEGTAGDAGELAEGKPKARARTKKVAEAALPGELESAVEAAPAGIPAIPVKPVKKAAKRKAKAAAEAVVESAPVAEAAPALAPVEAAPAEPAKKVAKRKAKAAAEAPAAEAEVAEPESAPAAARPEPKLERLQKILAKAGISSRRKAEELILGGRVQINGQVVMELGTKADAGRDHVRVDGKLLQGPERIRYFVLNKPKGFVTTVSDPEGRPTVMQFFAGEHERLYPVGRLDYLSEGLLLVTNDGELANKLTKAASGVEKTYLVKVAGQPTEDMLDVLRKGVVIERGRPGTDSGRVRTAPAQIRQVRQGDNPWYEVIVIEGRNRELRKMFEEIGHHVEKIRRVGYGPLVLDLEPGKMRELEAEEVHSLRLAAEGKLKRKTKKNSAAGQLPTVAGKTVRYKKADGKPGYEPRVRPPVRPEFQAESKAESRPEFRGVPKSSFEARGKPGVGRGTSSGVRPAARLGGRPEFKPSARAAFPARAGSGFKPGGGAGFKPGGRPTFGGKRRTGKAAGPAATDSALPPRKGGPPESESDARPQRTGPGFRPEFKPGFKTGARPAFRTDKPGGKPAFRSDGPPSPAKRFGGDGPTRTARPERFERSERSERPERPERKEFRERPARPEGRERSQRPDRSSGPSGPRGKNPPPEGRYNAANDDFVPRKTPGFRVEPVTDAPKPKREPERPRSSGKPYRPAGARVGGAGSSGADRPFRPRPERAGTARPGGGRSGVAPPRKFAGSRLASPEKNGTGQARTGPDGAPRVKERWRNSFTGKNKGRPKPKAKPDAKAE